MPRARSFTLGVSALAAPTRRRGVAGKQRLNNAQTKGDKVKPTEQFAKAAVTSKTGRFATLRGLLHAQGSSAPARSLVAAPLLVLCVSLALSAGVAQAEPPKLVSYGSFSAHEPSAVGVAVEGSGDLFVSGFLTFSEFAPESVVKFDPSGNLLSPPSPFGAAYYSGVAVNPTNGDVYVLGEEGLGTPAKIFDYDPNTGATVGAPFEVPAPRQFFGVLSDVQIATDSAGNIYVPEPLKKREKSPPGSGEYEYVPNDEVLEYSPSGTLLKTFTGSGAGALEEPTAVAIDSSGNLWVAGNNRIVELDSSGAPVEVNGKPVEIVSEGVWSVALDGHGDVFAVVDNSADPCGEKKSPCLHLIEYSAEGRRLADVGAGSFGTESGGEFERFFSMVAVNEASGRVYVTDGRKDTVWIFGPPLAPVVDRELTAEVGASEAKLGALVSPGGIQTSYRFEYGPTSAYGSSTPFPAGSVGEGLESHAVWASASGLAPGSTYHYRVVASNELGTAYGEDQTFTTLTAEEAACPNEQMRGGFSGKLPDCRAYELVTLPVTSGSQFDGELRMAYASKAAADGEALTLTTAEPRPGAPTAGEKYVARRGAGGWVAEDIMPLESYDGVGCANYQFAYAFSEQVTKDVIQAGGGSRATSSNNHAEDPESCNPEGSQVVSGEPVGYENLLVRDNATGTYQLVNVTPPGVTPADAHFQAASADLSHVIFTETSPLAKGARYGVENLYEWDEGAVRLVSVLPDGTAVPGSFAAKAGTPEHESVVSGDGSHVLFTYGGALYDRIDGQRTVQVDEQQGGPGPSGGGFFTAVTSDGSKVFFLDESKLTPDSTAESKEPDLYECALPEGTSKCELTDLTVAAAGKHADVLRVTPLGGHDSSDVYFVAKGVLASNTREFTNSEGQPVVEGAEAGKQNLYLWNGEKMTFIATGVEYSRLGIEQTSPDGKWLAFEAKNSLTGYDDAALGSESSELFLYSAGSGSHPPTLACASCNPTGEPAGAQGGVARRGEALGETYGLFPTRHVLTDAGQVFFETNEALVPSDTNGGRDVYEYEGGGAHLISSGTSSFETALEDVSESGDDVFFRSNQQLVPRDNQEGQLVTYDARVAGGFAEASSPPACTTADACRVAAPPQPSVYGAPASQTFSGLGNLAAPETRPKATPKAKPVKCKGDRSRKGGKKGKCVKKPAKKAKKSAHANRRGK
jgi:DNA-binding beta-propeller fold protein YncE